MTPPVELSWIDDFVRQIRSLVMVREEDDLLIILPNQAYKLNRSALTLLGRALAGESIDEIVAPSRTDAMVRRNVHEFFCDLRAALCGCLGEGRGRRAVEMIPFVRPFNRLPVLSEVALTYRCNLRCAFCYVGCPSAALAGPEMTTAQVQDVLRIIRHDAKVPSTSFTGGEPTLRDDLDELVASAVGTGLRVNLITNGTLIDDSRAMDLSRAGLASAQVSLEGASPATHDALTGVPRSFEKTLRGVRALASAGISVHTNTTVSRANVGELAQIVVFAADLGMTRLSMNLVIPCGSACAGGEDIWVRYSEVRELVLDARRAAREASIEFLWYSPTPYCMFNPLAEGFGSKSCAACDGLLSVAPTGDVLPCSSAAVSVGNLFEQPFHEIWSGARAATWRRWDFTPAECAGCDHEHYCGGACPLYWETVGTEELTGAAQTNGA